jgi:DNA mismatch repair protein MutS2
LRSEEAREVERILKQLTALVRDHLEPIVQNLALLTRHDIIHAKARLALRFECSKPALNERNELFISDGRHPLLLFHKEQRAQVVPLNIHLNTNIKTLIITGPNAGGKSVAMKTIGLFCLMVKAGLLIPAAADSNIPVFDRVFADIGDFQSIEHDLSTFTSHVKHMQTILACADNRSLVLMDEIGVGTDPDEGSALAIALLEALTGRGCLTIVTTHLGALKVFAFENPLVENGSMEFNMDTLEPVYKFRLGMPGSSYALEISKRLGVPEAVLKRSQQLVGPEKGRLEKLLVELERRLHDSEHLTEQLKTEKNRLDALNKRYEERYEKLKASEATLKQQAISDAEQIVADSNALIERVIKEIRETQAERASIQKAKQTIRSKQQELSGRKTKVVQKTTPAPTSEPAELTAGSVAFWQKQQTRGRISAIADDGGKVLLEVGTMKFWVPVNELSAVSETTRDGERKRRIQATTLAKSDVLPQIDVRGERLEDALVKVDKFLDDALLAGWEEIRIIHGKGTGALRKGIAHFLAEHSRVKNHKIGAWNEGDLGVTIVGLW